MEIAYRNNEVEKICEQPQFARKKYPDKIVSAINMLMYKLAAVDTFDNFKNNPANKKYRTHPLQGNRQDLIALYLDFKYRMTIKLKIEQNKIIIWEISNHYGD